MNPNPQAEFCWQPSASIEMLKRRAELLSQLRAFFVARGVYEVTTPVMAAGAATDPQIESFRLADENVWLQTSPEFHMKRLLAAGSGAIFQIAPAFRREEQGRWHNAEFSMLEWYRPGFDEHRLMDEVAALWCHLSARDESLERFRYAELIEQELDLSWSELDEITLRRALLHKLGELPQGLDFDGLLDACMGLLIGPRLGQNKPCFVFDFPASQAALAQLGRDEFGQPWARRFELYWQGLELANGFFELLNPDEQDARFERDLQKRKLNGQPMVPKDQALIDALTHGVPECAGVALGVDRFFALLLNQNELSSLMAFPSDRA